MHIGTVREIKTLEFRVGITPEGAAELVHHGHQAFVEPCAGLGIGLCCLIPSRYSTSLK